METNFCLAVSSLLDRCVSYFGMGIKERNRCEGFVWTRGRGDQKLGILTGSYPGDIACSMSDTPS